MSDYTVHEDDRVAAIKEIREAIDYIENGYPSGAKLHLEYALNSLSVDYAEILITTSGDVYCHEHVPHGVEASTYDAEPAKCRSCDKANDKERARLARVAMIEREIADDFERHAKEEANR